METVRLSFCEISFIDPNIVEVVTDEGIEINAESVREYHGFYRTRFDAPFGVLVSKKHEYSYDFSAMLKIGDIENMEAVAVLHFSERSKAAHVLNKMPRPHKLNMQHFFDRDKALAWLREQVG